MANKGRVMLITISPMPKVIASNCPNGDPQETMRTKVKIGEVINNPVLQMTMEEFGSHSGRKQITPDSRSFGTVAEHMDEGFTLINAMLAIRVGLGPFAAQISSRKSSMSKLPHEATNTLRSLNLPNTLPIRVRIKSMVATLHEISSSNGELAIFSTCPNLFIITIRGVRRRNIHDLLNIIISSVGYSLLLKNEKSIVVQPDRVVIGNGPAFGCVLMKDFLKALAKCLKHNNTAFENYSRIFVPDGLPVKSEPREPLRVNVLFQHIQNMLSADTAVIAETGDSWFNCQKLKLPKGCGYEFQMQYGSIGWSVGATLGYAQAVPEKRVIACIGDGSFQVTAQDVSTMLRCGQKTIIFLINNGGYTIEVEIHDEPYNVIKNWNYTGLVDAIHNGEGKCWTTKVTCEEELVEAIETATESKKECLCFIEVIVHKDDTSKELLEWGSRVSSANSRPPNPQ